MRDIVLEETIYMDFTTRAFASGVPTVLAGSPVLSVLEENNATPITAGVSISVDRASVVGLNMATIVATAANGYEAGKGYSVYISTGTVGGVSVIGEVVAQFTIDASSATQELANGTDGLTVLKASLDDIPTVAEFNARSLVSADYTIVSDLGTVQTADHTAGIADIPTVSEFNARTLVAASYTIVSDLGTVQTADHTAGIADIPTVAEFNARTLVAASYFDPTTDAVANVTLVATTTTNTDMVGTDSAALASVCTETRLAELDAGNLPTDVAAIPTTAKRGTDSALLAASISLTAGAVDTVTTVTTCTTNTDMVAEPATLLTTQMTEAYAADGTAPTLAQALMLIQQTIGDFAIAGTTITTKKLDGSTAAATYTLDDGTNPTSRTRTT